MIVDEQAMSIEDQIFMALICLMGEEGRDWNYIVTCEQYWEKWGEMNARDGGSLWPG